jgi:hypothetical protein
MGETEGESPVSFESEYNIILDEWIHNIQTYNYLQLWRSKSAIYIIQNYVLVAGGSENNYESYSGMIF